MTRHQLLLLLIIFFSALILRVHHLDLEGLSACEESFNHLLSRESFSQVLKICADSNQLPLPIFLQQLWHYFIPWTTVGARWLSALLGAVTIFPVFFLGRRFGGAGVGFSAALIMAAASSHVLHSRLIREYTLLVLLCCLANIFFFRWQEMRRTRELVFCLLFSTLALQIHYAAAAVVIALAILARNIEHRTLNTESSVFPLVASSSPYPISQIPNPSSPPSSSCLMSHVPCLSSPPSLSAFRAPQSAFRAPQSAFHAPLSACRTPLLFTLPFLPLLAWLGFVIQQHGEPVSHLYSSTGSYLVTSYGLAFLKLPWWLLAARDRVDIPLITDLVLILLLTLLFIRFWNGFSEHGEAEKNWTLLVLLSVPMSIGGLIFLLLGRDDLCKARYFLPQLPILAIIVARVIYSFQEKWRLVITATIICAILGSGLQRLNIDEEFQTGEKAIRLAQQLTGESSNLIVEPPLIADLLPALGMLPARSLRQQDPFGAFVSQFTFTPRESTETILHETKGLNRLVYLFYPYFDESTAGNPFRDELRKRYDSELEVNVGSATVRVYEGRREWSGVRD